MHFYRASVIRPDGGAYTEMCPARDIDSARAFFRHFLSRAPALTGYLVQLGNYPDEGFYIIEHYQNPDIPAILSEPVVHA